MYEPITIPGQQADEKIIIVLHRHWFVFVRNLIQVLTLAVLPFIALIVTIAFTDFQFVTGTLSYVLIVMGTSLYFLFLLMLLYGHWLDYALDVFIVSNRRVVDIEQAGLFNRTVAEQRLYRIQDVTYEVKGVIRTFFKFGDVHIQTAGEKQRFIFEDVANPDRVTELILKEIDAAVKAQGHPDPAGILEKTTPVPHHQHPPENTAVPPVTS
jgi:hypothetical protein